MSYSVVDFARSLGLGGKSFLLMLNIYLDDSGSHGGPYCFVAGILSTTEKWAAFSKAWIALCEPYLKGRPFKTSAAYREKDRGFIPEEGKLKLARCIRDHVDAQTWSVVPDSALVKIKKERRVKFDRYKSCFVGVISAVIKDPQLSESDELVGWIFDHQGGGPKGHENKLEYSLFCGFNEIRGDLPRGDRGLLHSIAFADDEVETGLQAADFLAWHLRRRQENGPDAQEIPAYTILKEIRLIQPEVLFHYKLSDALGNKKRTKQ